MCIWTYTQVHVSVHLCVFFIYVCIHTHVTGRRGQAPGDHGFTDKAEPCWRPLAISRADQLLQCLLAPVMLPVPKHLGTDTCVEGCTWHLKQPVGPCVQTLCGEARGSSVQRSTVCSSFSYMIYGAVRARSLAGWEHRGS